MVLYLVLLLSFISAVHMSDDHHPVVEEVVVAKHVEPLGGWHKASPTAKEVLEAAEKAVEKYNGKSKSKFFFKLLNVTSANRQITNTINFRINMTIGKTTCLKTEAMDSEKCKLAPKRLQCKFDVKYDPRDNQYAAQTVTCNKIKNKHGPSHKDKPLE